MVSTTVAGAAPTATLIAQLEKLGIDVCHVYGLTGALRLSVLPPLLKGTLKQDVTRQTPTDPSLAPSVQSPTLRPFLF